VLRSSPFAQQNNKAVRAGGLDYELTEGDIITIFSQYGEIQDLNYIRDKVAILRENHAQQIADPLVVPSLAGHR
jgi:RNA recognition motif-containing protein